MNVIYRSILTAAIALAPAGAVWAQESNPGNSGGGHSPVATATYPSRDGFRSGIDNRQQVFRRKGIHRRMTTRPCPARLATRL